MPSPLLLSTRPTAMCDEAGRREKAGGTTNLALALAWLPLVVDEWMVKRRLAGERSQREETEEIPIDDLSSR